jgi:glycosyltransferase involved in cell wall biosynthesis
MVIAVNTRFLIKDKLEGIGYFTNELLRLLTKQHPEHEFHFFFDRPYDQQFLFASNVTPHVISPPARHPLLWKYWFDVQAPRLLKKIRADVFFSPDGQCSLATRVPQCLVVHDLAFLHYPDGFQKSHLRYYKFYTPKFIRKAQKVLTVSRFSQQDIISQYGTPKEKIEVVYNGTKESFAPINFEEQNAVKDQYTGGTEFFLYTGAIHPRKNLVNLLKAFSIFKRRLHSSMKLVLTGRMAWKNNEFLQLLKTYKYREDVILTGYLEEGELAKLVASAYAFVYPSLFEGFGVPVLEAMRSGVPVLTSGNSAMEEISGDAALCFDPQNIDDIADKLMRIYKDEDGRRQLIEKGFPTATRFSWQNTADAAWKALIEMGRSKGAV